MPRMIWALFLAVVAHLIFFQVRMPEQEDAQLVMTGIGQVTVRIAHTVQEVTVEDAPEFRPPPDVVQENEPEPERINVPEQVDAKVNEPVVLSSPVLQPVNVKKSSIRELIEEETASPPTRQPDLSEELVKKVHTQISGADGPKSLGSDRPEIQAIRPAEPLAAINHPPVYPELARRRGWEGTVVLDVEVRNDGTVQAVQVQTSSSYSLLDEEALEAVRKWRFIPGSMNDMPIASKVMVPVHFVLQDS